MKIYCPLLLVFWVSVANAVGIVSTLPYPDTTPDGEEIAQQVYFVNHFFGVNNIQYGTKKNPLVLINRAVNSKPLIFTMERHLNNDYSDTDIRAMDLVIFRSGKLRGTGILVEDYVDPKRSLSFKLWLPALRKIRRHAEPDHGDMWGGSVFTFGDIYLRRPRHETHELLGTENFKGCFGTLENTTNIKTRYFNTLPEASCIADGKPVYKVKSSTLFNDWWYDYRLVWVDTKTFADYRSDYYKNGKWVKRIDKDWRSMDLQDPRNQYWLYWYGRKISSGLEAQAFINRDVIRWNQGIKPGLWSEQTLRKITR